MMSLERWAAVSLLAILLPASGAFADRTVPGIQIHVENWLFIPTLHDGSVETFVGLRTDSPTGDNITSMWFTLNPDSTWSVWGWDDQDQSKAVGYVKSFLALPDESDQAWPIPVTPVNPEDHPRKTMVRGVFEDDPLAEVVSTSTDADAVLEFLVTVGWEAARNPVIARCETITPWLEAMVEVVDQELVQPGSAEFDEPDDTICQGGGGGGITCTVRIIIGGITSNTCTGTWGPPATGTVPTTGGCYTQNCWSATVTQTQTRNVRKIYATCTSCLMTQTRTLTGTVGLCEIDYNVGCPPPPGYVPPVSPQGANPCGMTNITWGSWGAWAPPLPGQPGSPCP